MNKTPEELIEFAAVDIMGWTIYTRLRHRFGTIETYNTGSNAGKHLSVKHWNPLKDSNQLDLIRDKLLGMGIKIQEYYTDKMMTIRIGNGNFHYWNKLSTDKKSEIRLTKLTAYVEAMEKFKEIQKPVIHIPYKILGLEDLNCDEIYDNSNHVSHRNRSQQRKGKKYNGQ